MKQVVIFTDLDGTLLNYSTYTFEEAAPALQYLRQHKIPIIICSSKTKTEIERYRKKLDNYYPFISENGGGIFIPKGYFDMEKIEPHYKVEKCEGYFLIRLGVRYDDLRKVIEELQQEGFHLWGFGDMTPEEVAKVTGISTEEAVMAKEREFDEPFFFHVNEGKLLLLLQSITDKGFTYTQGKFFHILGDSDKGKAVSILTKLYQEKFGEIVTIALGDSPNDVPMLQKVDYPVIVQKPDGSYDPRIDLPNLNKAKGIGPEGWNRAVLSILSTIEKKGSI